MLRLLQAEWLKMWKDRTFLLTILGFLGAHAMIILMFIFGKHELVTRNVFTVYEFANQSIQMQSILMGPMMAALLGTYIVTVEYRQKTVKSLLPLPSTMPGLFLSKCVIGVTGLIAAMAICGLVSIAVPLALGAHADIAKISLHETIKRVAVGQGTAIVSLSALLIFAMFVSLITKNFVIPLGVAMVAQVAGLIIMNSDKFQYFWAARPLILSSKAMRPDQMHAITYHDLTPSLAFFGVFLMVSLLWSRLNPRPE